MTGKDKSESDGNGRLLDHGRIHRRIDLAEGKAAKRAMEAGRDPSWSYRECRDEAAKSVSAALKNGEGPSAKPVCCAACLSVQLDEYHVKSCGIKEKQQLRASTRSQKWMGEAEKEIAAEDTVTAPAVY